MSLFHKKIYKDIYHIGDGLGNFCTLIIGEQFSIVFDTLTGIYDLRGYIHEITNSKIIVINSHCHYDHFGGNYQFDDIYMAMKDFPLFDSYLPLLKSAENQNNYSFSGIYKSIAQKNVIKNLNIGTTIHLGNLTLIVVDLAGHTSGSIGLYVVEEKLLLAGDAISPQLCLFFPESLSVQEYDIMISKIEKMEIKHILLSHFPDVFERNLIDKVKMCLTLPEIGKKIKYSFSTIPSLHGNLYFLDTYDCSFKQPICIITKTSYEQFEKNP